LVKLKEQNSHDVHLSILAYRDHNQNDVFLDLISFLHLIMQGLDLLVVQINLIYKWISISHQLHHVQEQSGIFLMPTFLLHPLPIYLFFQDIQSCIHFMVVYLCAFPLRND